MHTMLLVFCRGRVLALLALATVPVLEALHGIFQVRHSAHIRPRLRGSSSGAVSS